MEIVETMTQVEWRFLAPLLLGVFMITVISLLGLAKLAIINREQLGESKKRSVKVPLISGIAIIIVVIVFMVVMYVSNSGFKNEYVKVTGVGEVEKTTTAEKGYLYKSNEVIVHIKTKDNKKMKIALDDVERKLYNLDGYMSKGDKTYIQSDSEYQLKQPIGEDEKYYLNENSLLKEK